MHVKKKKKRGKKDAFFVCVCVGNVLAWGVIVKIAYMGGGQVMMFVTWSRNARLG